MLNIYTKLFKKQELIAKRQLAYSNDSYKSLFPNNNILFNSVIYLKTDLKYEKIWYGDLDLTFDETKLNKIYSQINKDNKELIILEDNKDLDYYLEDVSNLNVLFCINKDSKIQYNNITENEDKSIEKENGFIKKMFSIFK